MPPVGEQVQRGGSGHAGERGELHQICRDHGRSFAVVFDA
jgi:hypothetical protein